MFYLLAYGVREVVARTRNIPSGVDQGEYSAIPGDLGIVPVASHSRLIIHDGLALTDKSVKKRGFPDVRSAYDGDDHGEVRHVYSEDSGSWCEAIYG